ncbi:MAG: hypothetical protein ABIN89_12215 [Chitinophagaceae bacterium]
MPAGPCTIYAGRGFQYGVDSFKLVVKPGDTIKRGLVIEKEVPLDGWISCDTHIHTRTYSGHGDASMTERIITLAGGGIELPVITEHNYYEDIDSLSRSFATSPRFSQLTFWEISAEARKMFLFGKTKALR